MKRPLGLLYFAAAAVVTVVAAGPYRGVTRPATSCSLPNHDYQYRDFTQPVRSVSAVGILVREPLPTVGMTEFGLERLRRTGDAVSLRAVKAFQFIDRPRLQMDHCSIAQITVDLSENGDWTISLRADQNPIQLVPPALDRDVTTSEETAKFTDYIKRNLFQVQLRCYARTGGAIADSTDGKPGVIPLEVAPFWVQRQQPRWYVDTGNDPGIRQYFDIIDHVEVEFAYGNRVPVGAEELRSWQKK
jgi:hypothetical protein